jgi:hypothetical protein
MLERRRLLLASMLALAGTPAGAGTAVVRYPRSEPQGQGDQSEHYPVRLLRMALAFAGQPHVIEPTTHKMGQTRALVELQNGRAIDVLWTMSSRQREAELLPVRIPLDMGLIGWRLLLIRKADVARFAAIRRVEELRALTALQGHDWPDTDILRANQFKVQTASDYAGMFGMLATERIDYFPRATFEIWDEAKLHAREGLVVAPGLALYYPSAFYYFVNKGNVKLAADIERGMQQMLADGSYDKLFDEYFGAMIERAALAKRRVFDLRNPLLPDATPLARRELWYRPR